MPPDAADRARRADASESGIPLQSSPGASFLVRVVPIVQQLTRSIPVVFVSIGDPVEQGVMTSLARPGANITGFTIGESSLGGKRLELLKEIAPTLERVGFVFNPDNPGAVLARRLFEDHARSLTLQPILFPIRTAAE